MTLFPAVQWCLVQWYVYSAVIQWLSKFFGEIFFCDGRMEEELKNQNGTIPLDLGCLSLLRKIKLQAIYFKTKILLNYLVYLLTEFFSTSVFISFFIFRRLGQSHGLLYKHLCHSLIDWVSRSSFVNISLPHRHALMVEDGAFSHKTY